MITGINRLQRPGRSYLHGVLRDAARPFGYRGGAQRLLQAGGASGLRPLYGNHFMPVAFRYLDAPYGYASGSSQPSGFSAAHSVTAPAFVSAARAVPAYAAAASASASAPAGDTQTAVSAVSAAAERIPRPLTPQPVAPIDIRIPGGDFHETVPRAAIQSSQQNADAPPLASSLKTEPEKTAREPEQEPRAKSGAQQPVPAPAAPLAQRLPPNLSLGALARMLERQNFEKPESITENIKSPDKAPESEPSPRSVLRVAGKEPAQVPMPERTARIKPAAVTATTSSSRMVARVAARPAEVRLPMPGRAAPADRARARQSASPSGREPQQKAGTARSPARARERSQARSPRRVSVIRRTAPAAFWERSYLSTLELRLFR
jgi:hypothetical protein